MSKFSYINESLKDFTKSENKRHLLEVISDGEMIDYIINYLDTEAREMDYINGSNYQHAEHLMESFNGKGMMFHLFQDILMDSITLKDEDEEMFIEAYPEIFDIIFS